MTAKVIDKLKDWHGDFTAVRRDIHKHPETAFEEVRTSQIVADKLESWGIEVHRGLAKTGVVGRLKAGTSNRSIGLRADMDALHIEEANDFDYASVNKGKMHACGHDGHTTMLLAAARYLAEEKSFDGTIHFIFQPAEENEAGGKVMVDDGLFEQFPCESVWGMHNWPGVPVGEFCVRPGPMMAGGERFDVTLTGRGTHAAMPHTGIDPVVAGSAIVQALQSVASRSVDPLKSVVLSVTQFHAGDTYNVIPQTVRLAGTFRYFDPEVKALVAERMQAIIESTAAAYGCRGEVHFKPGGYPPTLNTPEEADLAAEVMRENFGADHTHTDVQPVMGSEDFAYMLMERPGAYIWAGNGDRKGGCMVHHPNYDFNDDLIPLGATYWVRLAEKLLPQRA